MRSNTKSLAHPGSDKPGLAARTVATLLLTRVIDDHRNLDALCDNEHGLQRFLELEKKDKSLVRAILLASLRQRNQISYVLNLLLERPLPKKARHLVHTLHVAAAQILFLNVPDRAAVDIAVSAIRNDPRSSRFSGVANAILRRMAREKQAIISERPSDLSPFPKWFEKKLRTDHGREKLAMISEAYGREALIDISVKENPAEWAETLAGDLLPTGTVRLRNTSGIEELPGYTSGEWWVQDAASAIPAKLFPNGLEKRMLELCAAPGGKTAQLVNSGWNVTALDKSASRINRLRRNLDRLNFKADCISCDLFDFQSDELFDAILLDAPCTSTGTIRRHPDVVWTKTPESVAELAELQFRMIEKAGSLLAAGGVLVFSNCSIFKLEGEGLLSRSMEMLDDLQPVPIRPDELTGLEDSVNRQGAIRILPGPFPGHPEGSIGDIDGFFVCRFTKKQTE